MNKFSDDIREYDPLMWITIKKSSPKVKVKKEIKKELPPVIKKEPKELKNKNKINYQTSGKKWYEENKDRLKELRKNRIISQETKDNKYFYNKQYYENNRDELNRKRRLKDKERRDKKKLIN